MAGGGCGGVWTDLKGRKVSFDQSCISVAAASTPSQPPLVSHQLHRTPTVHTHSETNTLQMQPELCCSPRTLPLHQLHSNP